MFKNNIKLNEYRIRKKSYSCILALVCGTSLTGPAYSCEPVSSCFVALVGSITGCFQRNIQDNNPSGNINSVERSDNSNNGNICCGCFNHIFNFENNTQNSFTPNNDTISSDNRGIEMETSQDISITQTFNTNTIPLDFRVTEINTANEIIKLTINN